MTKFYVYVTEPLATGFFCVKMCSTPVTKVEADRWVASNFAHDFIHPYNDRSHLLDGYTRNLMSVDRWEYIFTFFLKVPKGDLEFDCKDAIIPLGKYDFDYSKVWSTTTKVTLGNVFRITWLVFHVLADLDYKM